MSQTLRYPPVDQAAKDPSFAAYRARLLAAVVRRDIRAILELSSRDIHLSFGGDAGHAALREFLTVDDSKLSDEYKYEAPRMRAENWYNLEAVLRLGGRFENGGAAFVAPYTFSITIPEDYDVFESYFVMGTGVVLRDRPIRFGRAVASLKYDLVRVVGEPAGTDYLKVKMTNGVTGFAHKDYLRSAIDYRAVFVRSNGDWKMQTFIAGD